MKGILVFPKACSGSRLMHLIVDPFPVRELDAVIGEHGVDSAGHRRDKLAQELRRDGLEGLRMQLGISELAGAVDGDKQGEPRSCGCSRVVAVP
jgi:hypothetical protein